MVRRHHDANNVNDSVFKTRATVRRPRTFHSLRAEQEKDIKKQQESAEYHYNLAYGHYFDSTRPNVDAAMHEVLQSLKAKPDFAKAHMLAGIIYLGREQYFKAIRHFKRAIEIEPKYFAAMNNLGAAYLASGRWDDAISVYKKLVSNIMYGTPGHGHNNLGWAYFKKGDLKKAIQHFSMAVNLAPRLCPLTIT